MRTFTYKGYDRAGAAARGFVDAENPKQARERLARDGILAGHVAPCGGGGARLPYGVRTAVYRELSALIEAGFPIVAALEALIASPDMRQGAGTLSRIRDAVRDGARLGDAVQASGCDAGGFEIALIQVAESSGNMAPVLARLAGYMESRQELAEGIRGALIYPLFVLAVGILAAFTMLGILLPRAQEAVASPAFKMPALTRFMLGFGRALMQWGWMVAVLLAILTALAVWHGRRSVRMRAVAGRVLLRLPVLGRGYRILINMRFSQALHLLLEGGVPLVDAFRMAGRATDSAWCMEEVDREAERLRHGDNIADCAGRIAVLRADMAGLLHVGQAGGSLQQLLAGGAARMQMQWQRFIKRTLAIVEPLLILIVGGFVLLVTLSVMLPMLSMTGMVPGR